MTALRIVALAAIALGIFFRLYALDRKTFWEDEIVGSIRTLGYTEAEIVRASPQLTTAADIQAYLHRGGRPLRATLTAFATEDPQHMPLFYLSDRMWSGWAGTSVAAFRTPAAIFGILAIAAIFWLARELFASERIAWIAAAIFALSPFAVLYSQEAREYSLWTLVLVVATALFVRARRTEERPTWMLYAVSLTIGLFVFPLTALVAAGHGVALALTRTGRRRAAFVPYLLSCAVAAACFLPWLAALNIGNGLRTLNTAHPMMTSAKTVVLTFLRDIRASVIDFGPVAGRVWAPAATVAGVGSLVLVAYAAWFLARKGPGSAAVVLLVGLTLPAAPLVLHDLIVRGGLVFQARYFVPVYVAVALCLAFLFGTMFEGARRHWRRALAWGGIFGLELVGETLSCTLSAQAATWWNKDYERTPAVAAIVGRAPRPLVVADTYSSRVLGLAYYLDPRVALHVRLHCDQCTVDPPRINLLDDARRFTDVYVVGTINDAPPPGAPKPIPIGVQIFPRASGPLDMFDAAF